MTLNFIYWNFIYLVSTLMTLNENVHGVLCPPVYYQNDETDITFSSKFIDNL